MKSVFFTLIIFLTIAARKFSLQQEREPEIRNIQVFSVLHQHEALCYGQVYFYAAQSCCGRYAWHRGKLPFKKDFQ
jgi:hypothetical protein